MENLTIHIALALSIIFLLVNPCVYGRKRRRIHGTRCQYTFIVNEMDPTLCPSPEQEFQSDTNSHIRRPNLSNISTVDKHKMQDMLVWLHKIEKQLVGEIVRNEELNKTIAKHEAALRAANERLGDYQNNFTSLFKTMTYIEQKLHQQTDVSKNLDNKLSGIILDVVEVNNVLANKVPAKGANLSGKQILVQAASKTRSCAITDEEAIFRDCAEVYDRGHKTSGVYYVTPTYSSCPVPVWCDMETTPGGWLLVQRRNSGGVDFNRNWKDYKDGFGDVITEYWLGNDNLFLFTNQDHYEMRVDLWDFKGNRVYALYQSFKIDGERDNYRLHIHSFEGSAKDGLVKHNKMMFSTPDHDNDGWQEYNCAREWEAGWWFNNCWFVILNGPYYNSSTVKYRGISWNEWKHEQLAKTEMKIRPSRIYYGPPTEKNDTTNSTTEKKVQKP